MSKSECFAGAFISESGKICGPRKSEGTLNQALKGSSKSVVAGSSRLSVDEYMSVDEHIGGTAYKMFIIIRMDT